MQMRTRKKISRVERDKKSLISGMSSAREWR